MICTSIGNCTVEECIAALSKLQFAEIRLDLLEGLQGTNEAKRIFSSHKNLIATCRPGKLSEEERQAILLEAITAGAAYVDIEVDSPDPFKQKIAAKAREKGCKLIVSFHDNAKTPVRAELDQVVSWCFESGAAIAKIACKANSTADCARLLGLLDSEKHLAIVAMGEKGKIVRAVAPLLGSKIAYASPEGGKGTADGQLSASSLERTIKAVEHELSQNAHGSRKKGD